MEPHTVAPALPRYSRRPFPPYRYRPGASGLASRHPRAPGGHAGGEEEDYLAAFAPDDWRGCGPYLYAVDLFNHGYWWEAHEALETVWLAAGQRATACGTVVQGLIQLAGAQLKRCTGEVRGAVSLTEQACQRLGQVDGIYLGIDLAALIETARRCLREDRGEYPQIILHV